MRRARLAAFIAALVLIYIAWPAAGDPLPQPAVLRLSSGSERPVRVIAFSRDAWFSVDAPGTLRLPRLQVLSLATPAQLRLQSTTGGLWFIALPGSGSLHLEASAGRTHLASKSRIVRFRTGAEGTGVSTIF